MTDRADEILDEFERSAGLPPSLFEETVNEAARLLTLTPLELTRMTASQCGEASVVLSQFAYQLQRLSNRETAHVVMLESRIDRALAPLLPEVFGWKYEERRLVAMKDPGVEPLEKQRVAALTKVRRNEYVASKVEKLADRFVELQRTKRGKYD